jgi:hypothetical protein
MHSNTGACFFYLQSSSRKAQSLDYHEDECWKLLQNNHTYIPNYTPLCPRKLELCVYLMASEECTIYVIGFNFFTPTLTQRKQKSKEKL